MTSKLIFARLGEADLWYTEFKSGAVKLNSIFAISMRKGTVSRDFYFGLFSWIIFPQASENNIRVISNFSKIRGDIRKSWCTTGINYDTAVKEAHAAFPPPPLVLLAQ